MSDETEITPPVVVVKIENQNSEPSVCTRVRKPKKKKASRSKKRKPAVRERKVKQEAVMDTDPLIEESLPPPDDENVFVSTPIPMASRKRKLDSPPVPPRSLRLKFRNDLMTSQDANETKCPSNSIVVLVDFLKEFNIQSNNINENSRFRFDQSGNIQLIVEDEINPPVPSTSQAQTRQERPSLYRQLAQMREEIDGLKKQISSELSLACLFSCFFSKFNLIIIFSVERSQ